MAEPWQCPACKTWIRPDVTEHRCEGGSAVPAIVPGPSPTGGVSMSTLPEGWTITTNMPATTGTTAWVPQIVQTALLSVA